MYPGINKTIVKCVKYHAKILKEKLFYSNDELEDIEQDLILSAIAAEKLYDPQKAKFSTFINSVIERKRKNIFRKKISKKYGGRIFFTAIDENKIVDSSSSQELDILLEQIDVNEVVKRLPPRLRGVCESLKLNSIIETAALLGRSQRAIHNDLKLLRIFFERYKDHHFC